MLPPGMRNWHLIYPNISVRGKKGHTWQHSLQLKAGAFYSLQQNTNYRETEQLTEGEGPVRLTSSLE